MPRPKRGVFALHYTPMVVREALASSSLPFQGSATLSQLTDRKKFGGPCRLCPDRLLLARQALSSMS